LDSLGAGTWVILQNCHLAISWLPRLEALFETINQELMKKDKERELKINGDFRLWLTTMSTDKFP
jgi:dynein heavy chain